MLSFISIAIISGLIVFFLDKHFDRNKQINASIDEQKPPKPVEEKKAEIITIIGELPEVTEQHTLETKKTTKKSSSKKKSNDKVS